MAVIFLIIGLIIGSFINAVVYRLNTAETLWERSHCPKCKKKIRWHDNIPLLSFVLLSARCRDCGEKISWQYPVTELVTGIIFALIGTYFFDSFDTATWFSTLHYLVVFTILMIIFVYDLKYMEIPMIILWMGVAWTIAYLLFADWQTFSSAMGFFSLNIVSGIIGGMAAFAFFYALAAYSKETWMGMGDAYLGLLAGLVMGWPKILIALMLAFTIGAIVSIILVVMQKKTVKSQVPFAPFLVVGMLAAILLPEIFPSLAYYQMLFW